MKLCFYFTLGMFLLYTCLFLSLFLSVRAQRIKHQSLESPICTSSSTSASLLLLLVVFEVGLSLNAPPHLPRVVVHEVVHLPLGELHDMLDDSAHVGSVQVGSLLAAVLRAMVQAWTSIIVQGFLFGKTKRVWSSMKFSTQSLYLPPGSAVQRCSALCKGRAL